MRVLEKSPQLNDFVIVKPHQPDTGFTGWIGWVSAEGSDYAVVNLGFGKRLAFGHDELMVVEDET